MTGTHSVKAMFHSTAMVPDYDRAVQRLGELIGLRVLEYSENLDPAVARRGGMTWIGDGSLELGEPTVADAAPDRFVRRTGGGMHGVALWVDDFAATVEHLESRGVPVPVRLDGFGFSSPRATYGLQFEWSEFTVPEDPRAGAPAPPLTTAPCLDVRHHAFVGAVVEDPVVAAAGLAELLRTPVLFEDPTAAAGEPAAALSLGDCALALFRLAPDESRALWGRHHDRPGVAVLGVAVDDLAGARDRLAAAGARVLREGDHLLVLDPATTGGVEVAVVDRLLPGDPRS